MECVKGGEKINGRDSEEWGRIGTRVGRAKKHNDK